MSEGPELDRIVGRTDAADVLSMSMMLYSLPRPIARVDAIAVLPGLGESWRLVEAVRAWEQHNNVRHLLVVGTYGEEKTQTQPTLEFLQNSPVNLKRLDGVRTQVSARHTKAQADWLADQIQDLEIDTLALFVSPYHLLRGYCTVLQSVSDRSDRRVVIIPMPVMVPPARTIPETGVSGWDMVNGEAERIVVYQDKGDVATYQQLKEHIDWMWQQTILLDSAIT